MMELRVASVILNRYRILEQLGEGGFATVYKAYDQSLDRDVAIKLVKPSSDMDINVERFEREAKLLSQVKHKIIISVLAFHIDAAVPPFIVMEYLEGITLRGLLNERNKLDSKTTYSILQQICEGLGYAHKLGLMHRDLSAVNIILTQTKRPEPVVKIIDFGLSRLFTGELSPLKTLTETGMLIGNPQYMSPEAIRGGTQDNRSDIYSLGCILYECLTGRQAFEADNAAALFYFHERSYPKEPTIEKNDLMGEILTTIALRCLQKDPEKRFQNCDEIIEALTNRQNTQKLKAWKDLDSWSNDADSGKAKSELSRVGVGALSVIAALALAISCIAFSDQILVALATATSNITGASNVAESTAKALIQKGKPKLAESVLSEAANAHRQRGETKRAVDCTAAIATLHRDQNNANLFLQDIKNALAIVAAENDGKLQTQVTTATILPLIERGRSLQAIQTQLVDEQQVAFSILLKNKKLVKRAVLRSAFDSLIASIDALPMYVPVNQPKPLVELICSYLNYAKPHLGQSDHEHLNGLAYAGRLSIPEEMQLWKCRCDVSPFTNEKRSAVWISYAQRKFMLQNDRSFDTVNRAWNETKTDPRADDDAFRSLRELQADLAILNKQYDQALEYAAQASRFADRHKHLVFIDSRKMTCHYLKNDQDKLKSLTNALTVSVMGGTTAKPGLPPDQYPSDYFEGEKGEEKFFEYVELTMALVRTQQFDKGRYVLRKLQEIVSYQKFKLPDSDKAQLKLLRFIATPPDMLKLADEIVAGAS